jgi:putative ABC transport system permease protein
LNKKKTIPPKLAHRLLIRFLRDDLAEEVQGDLDEKFYSIAESVSPFKARLNYWYQVFHYVRPFAIKKFRRYQIIQYPMFRNNVKIGWRNLIKNKGYSLINIGGLAVGMAVAIMVGIWVYDEVTFNSYHQNIDKIGQVLRNGTMNGVTYTTSYLPFPLAEELRIKYGSNFKHVLAAWPAGDHIVSAGDLRFTKEGEFIEAGGPEMFTLKMLKGTRNGLVDQHSIMLSASLANVLFGDKDPIGQLMMIDNKMDVRVTGVYKDLPRNTHFSGVDFFAPWDLFVTFNQWMTNQGFTNNFLDVYVEIQPNTTFERTSELISKTILNNVGENKEFAAVNPKIFLHPMKKWHLYSEWNNGVNTGGLIQYVWLFGLVGAFVLLLACINFMNLSTARSEKRAKEVGIRKAVGSFRRQLIGQFFTESFIVVMVAFVFSLVLSAMALDWFNELAGKHMTMPLADPVFWLMSISFIFFTGLMAGSYPALYLSSIQTIRVLKGTFRAGRMAAVPRKILVVVQFTVSVTLVICTMIVYQQIQYTRNRPVGYDRQGLLMIPATADHYAKLETIKTELKNTGVVEEVAESLSPVTGIWSSNGGFNWRGKAPELQAEFATLDVSYDYGKTVGWQFVEGRDFSRDFASDSAAFVINETAAKLMGFENPVDEIVTWEPGWRKGGTFRILGVIKDMVMRSPFDPAMPTVFFLSNRINWINIRIGHGVSTAEALPKIESVFKRIVPAVPFDYKFADQEYALKFAAEERIGKLAAVFAVLAILISCLGLFGLASFVAEQRTKEIGIRKVIGASVFNLWKMLSKDFVVMVLISCLIAIPIGWYLLSQWLQHYTYHTEIQWWIFGVAVTGAVAVTLMTVSYQAVKAALMNPVNSLKAE